MNDLWQQLKELRMEERFQWSVIDRWPLHQGYLDAVVDRINTGLQEFDEEDRKKVLLLFSAHSLPMKVVAKGDHYVGEVAASVHAVMQRMAARVHATDFATTAVPKHVLAWQSKVGFLPWMVPKTSDALEALGKRNSRHVLVVPIAFTSDHVETLFEIGIEYAEEAADHGITHFKCTEGLNGSPIFARALADIVVTHLDSGELYSPQYKVKCLGCVKPLCRQIINPAVAPC
jgi:ferrochelatase